MPPKKPSHMECLRERLATFEEGASIGRTKKIIVWPHETPSGEKMANHGFYFTPSKTNHDEVTCSNCKKKETNLEGVEEPAIHHFEHNPDCALAMVISANIKRLTNPDIFKWENVPILKDPTSRKAYQIRKKTFGKNWPHDKLEFANSTSEKMAEAGFYYSPLTIEDDLAICTFCGISLEGWDEDDEPLVEHRKRNPDCFILKVIDKEGIGGARSRSRSRSNSASSSKRGSKRSSLAGESGGLDLNHAIKKARVDDPNDESLVAHVQTKDTTKGKEKDVFDFESDSDTDLAPNPMSQRIKEEKAKSEKHEEGEDTNDQISESSKSIRKPQNLKSAFVPDENLKYTEFIHKKKARSLQAHWSSDIADIEEISDHANSDNSDFVDPDFSYGDVDAEEEEEEEEEPVEEIIERKSSNKRSTKKSNRSELDLDEIPPSLSIKGKRKKRILRSETPDPIALSDIDISREEQEYQNATSRKDNGDLLKSYKPVQGIRPDFNDEENQNQHLNRKAKSPKQSSVERSDFNVQPSPKRKLLNNMKNEGRKETNIKKQILDSNLSYDDAANLSMFGSRKSLDTHLKSIQLVDFKLSTSAKEPEDIIVEKSQKSPKSNDLSTLLAGDSSKIPIEVGDQTEEPLERQEKMHRIGSGGEIIIEIEDNDGADSDSNYQSGITDSAVSDGLQNAPTDKFSEPHTNVEQPKEDKLSNINEVHALNGDSNEEHNAGNNVGALFSREDISSIIETEIEHINEINRSLKEALDVLEGNSSIDEYQSAEINVDGPSDLVNKQNDPPIIEAEFLNTAAKNIRSSPTKMILSKESEYISPNKETTGEKLNLLQVLAVQDKDPDSVGDENMDDVSEAPLENNNEGSVIEEEYALNDTQVNLGDITLDNETQPGQVDIKSGTESPVRKSPSKTKLVTPYKDLILSDFNAIEASTPAILNKVRPTTPIDETKNIQKWHPQPSKKVFECLGDLENAADFLSNISNSGFDLHDDLNGELTNFISHMPEEELEMTIQEWVQNSAKHAKALLAHTCQSMLKVYEEESLRALQTLKDLPTKD